MKSEVGTPNRHYMHSSGKSGFLVYGPYLPLANGAYVLKAKGGAKRLTGTE